MIFCQDNWLRELWHYAFSCFEGLLPYLNIKPLDINYDDNKGTPFDWWFTMWWYCAKCCRRILSFNFHSNPKPWPLLPCLLWVRSLSSWQWNHLPRYKEQAQDLSLCLFIFHKYMDNCWFVINSVNMNGIFFFQEGLTGDFPTI